MATIEENVKQILPALEADKMRAVIEILEELGATDIEDLALVEEKDFKGIIKPIQARKLINAWKSTETHSEINPQYSQSSALSVPSSSPPALLSSPQPSTSAVSPSFNNSVKISWSKMPNKLIESLNKKKVPNASLRREMIRIVSNDILETTSSPNRKFCRQVAEQIANVYPESFTDKICGQVLSNGYESLTSQLTNRCENLRRNKQIQEIERIAVDEPPSTAAPAQKRKKITDSYGCVSWNPDFPDEENFESLTKKKEELKELNSEDFNKIKELMAATFSLQRHDINGGSGISWLLQEWPKLFLENGLHQHFQNLTADINLTEKLRDVLEKKNQLYFKFFTLFGKNKKLKKFLKEVEKKKDINEALALLIATAYYFEEDLSRYILTSEVCDPHNMDHLASVLPEAPCLVAIGTDALSADSFMMYIDKILVNSEISRAAAITAYFAAFYIFNIRYPDDVQVTLEFMQRCFFGINPSSGSKVAKKKGKKYMSINTKILAFNNKFNNFLLLESDNN